MKEQLSELERDANEPNDDAEWSAVSEERRSLSMRGRRAMQGLEPGQEQTAAKLSDQRPQDGHEFERWANQRYFGGRGRRLNVEPTDNLHLDKQVPSGLSLLHERRSDIYDEQHAEIWELKSGYERGGISPSQLDDYQAMLDAGYVYERMGEGRPQKRTIKAVHYLFATRAGAIRNASLFSDHDIGVWYVDDDNSVQHLVND